MVALAQRSKWEEIRVEFEAGSFKSLKELAQKHSISYQALRDKIFRERWNDQLATKRNAILQKVHEVKEDLASEYLSSTFKRAKRYEKMIDLSQSQQSTSNDGTPLLDVDAIMAYSKAELNIHVLAKSALRISDRVDVTSGGVDLGTSFISAIAKVREQSQSQPKLTEQDLDKVMAMEIVE